MALSVLIFFAILFALVFLLRTFNIGALVAFLFAGVISGPYVLNLFELSDAWTFLGDLGILFLWFQLGLEINMRRLWNMRRTIFGFGAAQVMMVAVMLFPILFGITPWSVMGAIMVSLLLAMSSTAEDMQLLTDRNQLNTTMGRQVFSILLFQDLLAIPLLAMLPVFTGRTFNLGATAIDVFVLSLLLIGGVVIVGRFILNPLLRAVAQKKSKEALLLAVMLNIILWAIGADAVGLPAGLGAFLAGMLMSETIYHHQISAEISPYATLFLAFFFIALGMGLNLPMLGNAWYMVLAGLIGLIVIKFIAIFIVARVRRVSTPDAAMIALMLAQGGEFGLLMLQTIKSSGIDVLPPNHQEILTAIIILSMMATPILLCAYDWLRRSGKLFSQLQMRDERIATGTPAVVICGFGRVGQTIAQMMTAKKIPYVAIDMDVNAVMLGRERGFNVVYGNTKTDEILRDVGLAPRKTRAVVIALDNVSNARETVFAVRRIAPRAKIFARARNLVDARVLLADGVKTALPETIESSFFLGYGVLEHLGVSQRQIDKLLDDLRADNYGGIEPTISDKQ